MLKTPSFFLILLLCAVLGHAIYIFFGAVPSLRAKFAAANKPFSLKAFFREDALGIWTNYIPVALWFLCISEFIKVFPGLENALRIISAFIGFAGGNFFLQGFGTMGKGIMKLLSVKANVSDATTGGTQTVEETVAKGIVATGVDVSQNPDPKEG